MKKLHDVVKDLTHSAVERAIDKDRAEWPPYCLWTLYQPHRPEQAARIGQDENTSETK